MLMINNNFHQSHYQKSVKKLNNINYKHNKYNPIKYHNKHNCITNKLCSYNHKIIKKYQNQHKTINNSKKFKISNKNKFHKQVVI
jgi:hypothetical protein